MAGFRNHTRRHNFIPGRNDCGNQPLHHPHPGQATGSQNADIRNADPSARRNDYRAGRGVVAAPDDVLAGRNRLFDQQPSVGAPPGIFLHDHRIGTGGQYPAGRHPNRLPGLNPQNGLMTHPNLADHFKPNRCIGACRHSIPGDQGVTVDGGTVELRIVCRIDNIFGGNSAQCLLKIDHFRMAWQFFRAIPGNPPGLRQRNQIPAFHSQCLQFFLISGSKNALPSFQQTIKTRQLLAGRFKWLPALIAEWIFLHAQSMFPGRPGCCQNEASCRAMSRA